MKQLVVKPEKCIGCRTCELVCSFGHHQQFNPRLANITVREYESVTLAVPVVCQQCEDPACVKVCPKKAITRGEDGVVRIDYDLCISCQLCRKACPYEGIRFSPSPRRVFKCDLCGGDPKCVRYCPGGALAFEEIDGTRTHQTADQIAAAMGWEG